jgi:hypothetical protein
LFFQFIALFDYISNIPEGGLGLPKPYGGLTPFLPTEQGATMRHIRKPKPKEIDLLGS